MTRFDIAVAALAALTLAGIVVLSALGKSGYLGELVSVLTALVGYLIGSKKGAIAGIFRRR